MVVSFIAASLYWPLLHHVVAIMMARRHTYTSLKTFDPAPSTCANSLVAVAYCVPEMRQRFIIDHDP